MNIPPEIWKKIVKYSNGKPFYTIIGNSFMVHGFRIHLDRQFSFDIPIFIDESEKSYYIGINSAQVANALDECIKKVTRTEDFVFSWTYGEDKTQFGTDRREAFNLSWNPEENEATYSVVTTMGFPTRYTMPIEQFLSLLSVLKEVAMQDSSAHGPWKTKGDDYIEPYVKWFKPYIKDRWLFIGKDFYISPGDVSGAIPTQSVSALDDCIKKVERGEKFIFSLFGDMRISKFNITFSPKDGCATFAIKKRQCTISRFRFLLSIRLLQEMLLSRNSSSPRWNQEADDYIEQYFVTTPT